MYDAPPYIRIPYPSVGFTSLNCRGTETVAVLATLTVSVSSLGHACCSHQRTSGVQNLSASSTLETSPPGEASAGHVGASLIK